MGVETLITLIVFLAIVAIVWWLIQSMGLPQPVVIVFYAIVAIIAIILLLRLVPHGRLF